MKSLRLALIAAAALAAAASLTSCSDKEEEQTTVAFDDAYYAAKASIGSDSPFFTANDDGGEVNFMTSGGEVVVNVDCGTSWTAVSSDDSWLDLNYGPGTLILSCGYNTEELQLSSTVTLSTATDGIRFAVIYVTQNAYGAPEISVETGSWHAPAAGELSVEVAVEATTSWTAETDAPWLRAEAGSDILTLTASANETAEERTAEVVLTASDGIQSSTATLTVTQDAAAYVTLDREKVSLLDGGDSATVGVESNYDWTYSYDEDGAWFTVERTAEGLTVTASSDYDGEDNREAEVTVTAGDGAANIAEAAFTVSQYGAGAKALVLVYRTTGSGNTVALPVTGDVDCTVDWGDGSDREGVTTAYATHVYASAGEYDVTITGTVTSLNSNSAGTNCKNFLTGVRQWGLTGLTSMKQAFSNCASLGFIPTDEIGSFKDVTTFANAFQATVIKEVPEGLFDHCGNVETFQSLFYNNQSLRSLPDRLFSRCTSATTAQQAFQYCYSLTLIPAGLLDGCTNMTNLMRMFQECPITQIPAGLFDPVRETVTSFSSIFSGCTGLTALPEGLFKDCTAATTFASAFNGCTSLAEIPAGLFSGCSAATAFKQTFEGCTALKTVAAGVFEGCASASDFTRVFYNCTSLETLPEGLFAGCAPETFEAAFAGCSGLTGLPAGLFSTGSGVTTFYQVFTGCTSLSGLPAGLFDGCIVAANFQQAFDGCTALAGESPYTEVGGVRVHLYDRDVDYGFVKPTKTSNCFRGCTALSDYGSIPSGWL